MIDNGYEFDRFGSCFRHTCLDLAPIGAAVADDNDGTTSDDIFAAVETSIHPSAQKIRYNTARDLWGKIQRKLPVVILSNILGIWDREMLHQIPSFRRYRIETNDVFFVAPGADLTDSCKNL